MGIECDGRSIRGVGGNKRREERGRRGKGEVCESDKGKKRFSSPGPCFLSLSTASSSSAKES